MIHFLLKWCPLFQGRHSFIFPGVGDDWGSGTLLGKRGPEMGQNDESNDRIFSEPLRKPWWFRGENSLSFWIAGFYLKGLLYYSLQAFEKRNDLSFTVLMFFFRGEMMVGRVLSFSNGPFSGAMLIVNFRRCKSFWTGKTSIVRQWSWCQVTS